MTRYPAVFCLALGCGVLPCVAGAQARTDRSRREGEEPAAPVAWRPTPRVDFGLDLGLARRPASGERASYATALSKGGHVRVTLTDWLGLRVLVQTMQHAVSVREGGLGVAGARTEQPSLEVLSMQSGLEPTWSVAPHVRLWGGPWMGWGRITAPEPRFQGALRVRSADRYGVIIEAGLGIGTTYEIVPRWVTVNTALGAGFMVDQSGLVFDEQMQGFDQDGHRIWVDRLPKFAGTYQASLGIGVLL